MARGDPSHDLPKDVRDVAALVPLGFAVTNRAPGTLQGVLGRTKLEFLHADRKSVV